MARGEAALIAPELLQALRGFVEALERLGVRHYLVGSVASSFHGKPRLTLDADLVADLRAEHASPLREQLETTYYIDEEMILDAIKRRRSFNVVHFDTSMKLDVYVPPPTEYAQLALSRAESRDVGAAHPMMLGSAEDILLYKLYWYRLGNEVSDRQWSDILGILEVQLTLDGSYLQRWAVTLGVADLLKKALQQVR